MLCFSRGLLSLLLLEEIIDELVSDYKVLRRRRPERHRVFVDCRSDTADSFGVSRRSGPPPFLGLGTKYAYFERGAKSDDSVTDLHIRSSSSSMER